MPPNDHDPSPPGEPGAPAGDGIVRPEAPMRVAVVVDAPSRLVRLILKRADSELVVLNLGFVADDAENLGDALRRSGQELRILLSTAGTSSGS